MHSLPRIQIKTSNHKLQANHFLINDYSRNNQHLPALDSLHILLANKAPPHFRYHRNPSSRHNSAARLYISTHLHIHFYSGDGHGCI